MAVANITMKMTAADGKPIAELQRLIGERVRLIKGETTTSAVAATAINILNSVKSATAKAKPDKAKFGFTIAERDDLVAGYKNHKRIIRQRGGHELASVKVINVAGAYQPKEIVKVYIAIIRYGKMTKDLKGSSAFDRYYIIARNEQTAAAAVERRLRRRIELFAGMAKWVVGQAQRQVSVQMNARGGSAAESVKSVARRVGLANLKVICIANGLNSGTASVYVLDGLDYAIPAVRGGSAALNTIYMKAANKTASIINHWVNHMGTNLFSPGAIEAPFPEVRARR